MKAGWNCMLARLNRAARRQRTAVGNRQSAVECPEGVARMASPPEEEPGMVEVAPGRFVNERTVQKLREAGL